MPSQTLSITADANDGMEDFSNAWTSNGATDYTDEVNWIGLSFILTADVPAGSNFTGAYVRVRSTDSAGTFTVTIGLENADPATNTVWSGTHLPSGASIVGSGTNPGSQTYSINVWYFGSGDTYPTNLAANFNTLFGSNGPWATGERINLRIFASDATFGGEYLGIQDSNSGTNDPELSLTWTEPGGGTYNAIPLLQYYQSLKRGGIFH